MLKTLKNSFTQAALGSTFWITLLASINHYNQTISFHYIWHLLFIGLLCGLVFGVIYPYLWNFSTFKSYTNIVLSTFFNCSCMFVGVYLYSKDLFTAITVYYWICIILLTLVGHIIGFYFYSNYQNKRLKKDLQKII